MHIQRSEPGAREARREHGLGDPELGSSFNCKYYCNTTCMLDIMMLNVAINHREHKHGKQ